MNHLLLFENFNRNLERLLFKLKTYDLDKDSFAIFGSAPLVITGELSDVNDLDVIIKPSCWPFSKKNEFRDGEIEFFDNWDQFDIDDLIDNKSFTYNGFNFINPEFVYKYKKQMGRDKDKDIWSRN